MANPFRRIRGVLTQIVWAGAVGAMILAMPRFEPRAIAAQDRGSGGLGPRLERGEQSVVGVLGPLGEWPQVDIMLNNNQADAMAVVPSLYVSGREIVGESLVLGPGETRWTPVRDLFQRRSLRSLSGATVTLRYSGYLLDLRTQIVARRGEKTGSVDVLFIGAGEFRSRTLNGAWVTPAGGNAVITIANTTDDVVNVMITSDRRRRILRLSPHQTETLIRPGALDRVGADAISIAHDGAVGAVRAGGYLEFGSRTFGILRFYDPRVARQPNLAASNLRVKGTMVQMALFNASSHPLTVKPEVRAAIRQPGSSTFLPGGTLQPGKVMIVDTRAIERLAADRISVRVVSDGGPGDLVGYLAAIDRSSLTAFELPLREPGPVRQSTGNYPWRLDHDYSSIASIANVSDVPATFSAVITYDGGVYRVRPEVLDPGGTATFDLRQIRDQRLVGLDGETLPREAMLGQFKWSIAGPVTGGRLNGRMEIVSRTAGQSSSYSCGQCCPDSYWYGLLQPSTVFTPTGLSRQFTVISQMRTCSGSTGGQLYAYATSWNVASPSVTSVNTVGYGSASASGLSGGDSGISGFWTASQWEPFIEDCYESPVDAGGSGDVEVKTPTSLSIVSSEYLNAPPAPYDYLRIYQIRDQNGQPMQGFGSSALNVTESYTPNPASGNCSASTISTGGGYAFDNGQFIDNYTLTGSPPNPCTSTSTQKHFVNGHQVSTISVTWTYSGVTVSTP